MNALKKNAWIVVLAVVIGVGGYYAWKAANGNGLPEGIASGNGRIEATEIDVSALAGGKLRDVVVKEGDFVTAGQVVAQMDTDQLDAQKRQAEAQLRQAEISVDTARSLVRQRQAEREAARAVVAKRVAQLDVAERQLRRTEPLASRGTVSEQILDNDRAAAEGARAAKAAADAQLAATEAGVSSAQGQVVAAEASVDAARASLQRIESDLDDTRLIAPRDGRVQFRVAEPGEVLAAGGRVLNVVDLSDVYMTFFLPTDQAGRIAMGADARIVLDAAPQWTVPATVSYVADVAQFTPKTVETTIERQKLMFRVRARIAPELLKKYIQYVKTGLPGVAYVKVDPQAEWPVSLEEKLVQ